MDKKKASKEIMEIFIRAVAKYIALEKIPVKLGTKHPLYHSERHMIDKIGDHPGMNVTEFANISGVTKGAISQVVKKLEKKGVVKRYKKGDNDKEVLLELTREGLKLYEKHKQVNEETIKPLYNELSKYSDDKVKFFISMFRWIEDYLDESKERMEEHHKKGC
jgi:DNA-binding MarR family transcriptional regulator